MPNSLSHIFHIFFGKENLDGLPFGKRKMLAGWWFELNPSEKYEFVIWDDEIPNISGKNWKVATKPPTSWDPSTGALSGSGVKTCWTRVTCLQTFT